MTWGKHGSAIAHQRYMEVVSPRSRRRCHCGCRKRASRRGMANGVALTTGCEMYIRRWVRDGVQARSVNVCQEGRQSE